MLTEDAKLVKAGKKTKKGTGQGEGGNQSKPKKEEKGK